MYVVTFYSFKGGVGRTMALVNVAAELVRQGRRVLVVDFDLEAPGLETYKHLRPGKPHPGIVEYVTEYWRTFQVPDLRDFVYEAKPIGRKGGQLWVMPAGRRDPGNPAYRKALVEINWQRLYRERDGFLLFEDTRKGWETVFEPDYVLIDSRTGDTDVLGICTRQLPDAVVLMFTPNEQNLAGLEGVCRDIRAEETSGLKKPIKLHFVASNVLDLDDEDRYLQRQMDEARARLKISSSTPIPVIHRNETHQMLDQPIFVLERPHSRLAREYRFMVRALQIDNPKDRDGALLFLREMQKTKSKLIDSSEFDSEQLEVVPGLADDPLRMRVNKITDEFWNDAQILLRVGQLLLQHKNSDSALIRLNRALELEPDFAEALFERGLCRKQMRDGAAAAGDLLRYLGGQGSKSAGTAALELLSISVDYYLKALELPSVHISPLSAAFLLIQQRRWDDAIRCLEHPKVKALLGSPPRQQNLGSQALPSFYLAMAHWGQAGKPSRQYSLQSLDSYKHVLKASAEHLGAFLESFDPTEPQAHRLQELALLYWGAGDIETSAMIVDCIFECLHAFEGTGYPFLWFDFSHWTFQETTLPDFRRDVEEMARMIRGEPIQPAFLRPRS